MNIALIGAEGSGKGFIKNIIKKHKPEYCIENCIENNIKNNIENNILKFDKNVIEIDSYEMYEFAIENEFVIIKILRDGCADTPMDILMFIDDIPYEYINDKDGLDFILMLNILEMSE